MAGKSDPSFDGLPSYPESVSSSTYPTPSIPNKVARARSALISTLVTTQLLPHLHSNVLSGLSNTTLLIIPTNVSELQPPHSSNVDAIDSRTSEATHLQERVVGFLSSENLTLVRLQGQENSLGFWCQPTVVIELEHHLRSQLQREGQRVVGGNASQRRVSNAEWRTIEKKPLQTGEAGIEVGIKEISLRTENTMGLYETRTGKAVVVKVEVGG